VRSYLKKKREREERKLGGREEEREEGRKERQPCVWEIVWKEQVQNKKTDSKVIREFRRQ
jgi:hypothetical protein